MDDSPGNIRQAEIPTLKLIGQPPVIQPQQMQNCGMQIVHVNRLGRRKSTEFVSGSDRLSRDELHHRRATW